MADSLGNDAGTGDKLLHVLSKWDVLNVVVVITRWDDSIMNSTRLGVQRFAVAMDRAKAGKRWTPLILETTMLTNAYTIPT